MDNFATLISTGLVIIVALIGVIGLLGALLFRQQDRAHARAIAWKDEQFRETNENLNSYRGMFGEASERLQYVVRIYLESQGKKPPEILAPVVPEHSSPISPRQQLAADIATSRAALTAIDLAIGYPPRGAGEGE